MGEVSALILGIFILLAVCVFVMPEYAPTAWDLGWKILKYTFWIIIAILVVIGILAIIGIASD